MVTPVLMELIALHAAANQDLFVTPAVKKWRTLCSDALRVCFALRTK